MFGKKKEKPVPQLTEDEYVYLDMYMLMGRFAGKQSKALEKIIKPMTMELFDTYYQDRPAPEGEIRNEPIDANPLAGFGSDYSELRKRFK
jgi:hypothetical protein